MTYEILSYHFLLVVKMEIMWFKDMDINNNIIYRAKQITDHNIYIEKKKKNENAFVE